MPKEIKYCCEAHVDIAFDDFLLDNETFPNLEKCEDVQCSYCNDNAKYVLT